MKRILTALMLMPLSSFAMDQKDEFVTAISLTRDGEGDKDVVLLYPNGKEVKKTFPMFSRDLKSKYEYTVVLSLKELRNKKATIEGYVSRAHYFKEDNNSVGAFTETVKIDKQEIPVNERNIMEFKYLSDMDKERSKASKKLEIYPVTLGLVVLDLPKAKL